MNTKKFIQPVSFLFALTFFMGGCNGGQAVDNRWIDKEHRLVAENVYPDKPILRAWPMVQMEEHIIIWQPENEREFSVFHPEGDSLKYDGAFLSTGRGPNEVNAGYVFYVPENKSVVIVGYNYYGKTFVIPVDDVSNLFSHDKWREYNTKHTSYSLEVIPVDTISYLIHIIDDRKIFSMLDIRSQTTMELSTEYPDNIVAPDWEKAGRVYGGKVSKRPWSNRFAYSSGNGHYVVICTCDENMQVTGEKVVFNELPEYSVRTGEAIVSDNCLDGLAMAVSESYIYLGDKNLTLGDHRSDSALKKNGYPAGYTKTIYVCDWEGAPVAKYMLDIPVVYYSVDKNDNYLYAFSYNENTFEESLVRFKLPDLNQ